MAPKSHSKGVQPCKQTVQADRASSSDQQSSGLLSTPKTSSAHSFASIVKAPIKPMGLRQADWDVLLQHFQTLEEANRLLKQRVETLETQVKQLNSSRQEDDVNNNPLLAQVEAQVSKVAMQVEQLPNTIHKEVQEQWRRESFSKKLRIGGLPPNWHERGNFVKSMANIRAACPQIQWSNLPLPNLIEDTVTKNDQGKHCILSYATKEDRDNTLRQSSQLKGTNIWFAEELTFTQLKHKKSELAKVQEARKAGKWAVYREGKAVIGSFKTKLEPPDDAPKV